MKMPSIVLALAMLTSPVPVPASAAGPGHDLPAVLDQAVRDGFERALFTGRLLPPAQLASIVARVDVACDTGPVPVWETDGGGPGFTSIAVTTVDGSRQLILVGTVFDIAAELRGDDAVPASAALPAALRAAICG